jgi:hypothetical protein
MTDRTSPHMRSVSNDETVVGRGTPGATGRRAQGSRSAARARIVVAGMGFTAMLALVGTMELSEGHAQSSAPAPSSAATAPKTVVVVHPGAAPASIRAAAGVSRRPIVLTAHPVVRTIKSPSSGGSGASGGYVAASSSGGSGYVSTSSGGSAQAAAPAPAAAPVASTSGSH